MASFNRVILIGNLTRDPELRYVQSGMAVTDIGLAVNDRRKSANGEWVEETTFVDVTLWGRTAELAGEYLSKGSPAMVEGRLKLDTWEGKDGQKRSKLHVVAEKLVFLGGGRGGEGGGAGGGSGAARSGGQGAPRGGQRGGQRGGGGGSFNQSAPPDEMYDAPPPEEPAGGGGGGDDIPF